MFDRRFATKKWSQSTNLVCESSPDVLRCIVRQVTDAGYDACQDDLSFDKFRETWESNKINTDDRHENVNRNGTRNLTSSGGPYFCLVVFQELNILPD